jgi:hypothetical protein
MSMSGYYSALGPIPDEWFENDIGPDEEYKKMHPAGFLEFLEGRLKGFDVLPEDSTKARVVTARTAFPDGE